MKVLAVICSYAGERSHTARLADMLFSRLNQRVFSNAATYERITLDQIDMQMCRSCSGCFNNGRCPQDANDDMDALKKKMLSCDVLILGSPVYVAHVSGGCKTLIDRCALWTHTLSLAGKICIPVSTTSSNNLEAAVAYTSKVLACMGGMVPCTLAVYRDFGHPHIYDENDMEPLFTQCCTKVAQTLAGRSACVTDFQERYFKSLKHRYAKTERLFRYLDVPVKGEAAIWQESGYGDFDTFAELLIDRYGA